MAYIKENHTGSVIRNICICLFQLCVITDAVIGFDPRLYVISKGCMLAFFIFMLFNMLWNMNIMVGKTCVYPVLFMLITSASTLWAAYPDASIYRLQSQVQFYVLYFFVYALFINEDISVKKYFDALYIAGVGMALFALYRYGLTGIIRGLKAGQRMGGMITNENVFGMVFSKASIVAYYYHIRQKKFGIRSLHLVLVIVFTFFAFSSGSKKAFLMIVFGTLGINLLENGLGRFWKTILTSMIVICGIIVLLHLPILSAMNQRIQSFFSAGNDDNSDAVRRGMIELSLQLFAKKPFAGYGFNNFGVITGLGAYSHNNMTELLVSTGILGFIIFYIPYYFAIKWGWIYGVKKRDYIAILLFILTLIYLVFGYGMVEYYDKEYWMFLGVMIACIDNARLQSQEGGI